MSDYGLQIKNSSGGIQIDSTYRNYSLWDSGTYVYTYGSTPTFKPTNGVPIFVWQPISTSYHTSYGLKQSGGNYTGVYFGDPVNQPINWAVFTEQPVNTLPQYGLVIRNANNEVVFSSDERYLKFVGVYPISFLASSHQDISVVDADNNYFFMTPYAETGYAKNGMHVYPAQLLKLSKTKLRAAYAMPGGTTTAESDPIITNDTSSWTPYHGTLLEVSF